MKKSKGQTVDLLYVNKNESNKKQKKEKKKRNTTKKNKNKTTKTKKTQNKSNERINLDNEIIIGLTPKKEETIKTKSNKKPNKKNKEPSNNQTKKRNKPNKKPTKQAKIKNNKKKKETIVKEKVPKAKYKTKIIKWMLILILLLAAVILFMMSSIFNIKQIVVLNNNQISSQEIINLSTLTPGVNMFKITNKTIRNNIKTNAYIEDVSIKRNVNGTVTLDIKERKATYMLKTENSYIYINNQGYMLEISETPLELPTITGIQTPNEEMVAGNRLVAEDLSKLEDVIKIMESAKNSSLADIINEIDISDSTNYKLVIKSESKTIQFGDTTNINVKLQMINKIIDSEKGKTGEIYFQEDAKKAVFKEGV